MNLDLQKYEFLHRPPETMLTSEINSNTNIIMIMKCLLMGMLSFCWQIFTVHSHRTQTEFKEMDKLHEEEHRHANRMKTSTMITTRGKMEKRGHSLAVVCPGDV